MLSRVFHSLDSEGCSSIGILGVKRMLVALHYRKDVTEADLKQWVQTSDLRHDQFIDVFLPLLYRKLDWLDSNVCFWHHHPFHQILLRCFCEEDTNRGGLVDFNRFAKALSSLSWQGGLLSLEELSALFKDAAEGPVLPYRGFVQELKNKLDLQRMDEIQIEYKREWKAPSPPSLLEVARLKLRHSRPIPALIHLDILKTLPASFRYPLQLPDRCQPSALLAVEYDSMSLLPKDIENHADWQELFEESVNMRMKSQYAKPALGKDKLQYHQSSSELRLICVKGAEPQDSHQICKRLVKLIVFDLVDMKPVGVGCSIEAKASAYHAGLWTFVRASETPEELKADQESESLFIRIPNASKADQRLCLLVEFCVAVRSLEDLVWVSSAWAKIHLSVLLGDRNAREKEIPISGGNVYCSESLNCTKLVVTERGSLLSLCLKSKTGGTNLLIRVSKPSSAALRACVLACAGATFVLPRSMLGLIASFKQYRAAKCCEHSFATERKLVVSDRALVAFPQILSKSSLLFSFLCEWNNLLSQLSEREKEDELTQVRILVMAVERVDFLTSQVPSSATQISFPSGPAKVASKTIRSASEWREEQLRWCFQEKKLHHSHFEAFHTDEIAVQVEPINIPPLSELISLDDHRWKKVVLDPLQEPPQTNYMVHR